MASLAHHFLTMACNNAWANHRLLKACAQLAPDEFAARRTGFFPSIKATLNHIVTVDWFYVDMLERAVKAQPPNLEAGRFFDPEEPFDTCAPLAEAQRAVDRRLIALCKALTDAQLDDPRSTTAARCTRCSPAPPSGRRSSMSSSAATRRRCGRRTSPNWGSARRRSGARLEIPQPGPLRTLRRLCAPPLMP
ncbi:MAG: damage-inducible protein DinB, partial [Burkholderiaceae bacterium]|nr:damage-inducible protein DinB [Burkholderiaceae bacterium]